MYLGQKFNKIVLGSNCNLDWFVLIILIFNTAVLAFSFPNLISNVSNSHQLTSSLGLSTIPDLTPKNTEIVDSALKGFSGGFIVQGNNGDPLIKYFIRNPIMSIGFGQSMVKMIIKDSMKQESTSYTEITLTFPKSQAVNPVASDSIASSAFYYIGSNFGVQKHEYLSLIYKNLYNHIDLEYTIKDGFLKYNFYVYSGGDPQDIQMKWSGPVSEQQTTSGMKLTIITTQGQKTIFDQNPISLQSEKDKIIESSFKVINNQTYGFNIDNYDTQSLLVIDPTFLMYSTYLGGSGEEEGYGISVDSSGNACVTGATFSNDYPTLNAYNSTYGGNILSQMDAFVFKISSNGILIYSTYLGGSSNDYGESSAFDSSGNCYVSGVTVSTDFPTLNPFSKTIGSIGSTDAFIAKFSTNGSLLYSTYLGGSVDDPSYGIAVDKLGNIYVTGFTTSTNFPTSHAYQSNNKGGNDAFITKFSTSGSLIYSTYFGGSSDDFGRSIAVDNLGNAYVTGYTFSNDFPAVNAFNSTFGGVCDAFVAKFSAIGLLVYSTYLGGNNDNRGYGIAVDSLGNAYVTGYTASSNFPTLNAFNSTYGAGYNAYITKFSSSGSLVYSTYFGGSNGNDEGQSIAVDSFGNVLITGLTTSTNLPILNPYNSGSGGNGDFFVAKFSSNNSLLSSTLLGGTGLDWAYGIATDSFGNAYVMGSTSSSDFPVLNPYYSSFRGVDDVIVAKFVFQSKSSLIPSSVLINPSILSKSLQITWNSPSYDDYFSQYSIYRSTDSVNYKLMDIVSTPNYIDSNVSLGVKYDYILSADYTFGSFNTSEITGFLATVPSDPSLQVSAGNRSVFLTWSSPNSDGGSPILEYNIYRGTQSGQYSYIGMTSNLYFNDTGLSGGTNYYYVICAVNSVGKGTYSLEKTATPYGSVSYDNTVTVIITFPAITTTIPPLTTTIINNQTITNSSSSSALTNSPGFELETSIILLSMFSIIVIIKRRNH